MHTVQSLTFGALLKRYREAAGLTQEELAERAELSVRGLIYLERGQRRPYPSTVRRLADALGYAAFSPPRQWTWEELIEALPHARASWLTESAESACAELANRLQSAPL